jgi:hypothetical protein
MPQLTKEQWAEIEQRLSGAFGMVKLKADGYDVTLEIRPYKELRSCIVVFVDGYCRGEWFKGEAPEARKFCQEQRRWLYPLKQREEAKRKLKQRRLDDWFREHYTKVSESFSAIWSPYWMSPKSLTRQLRKTCVDVEIVELGYSLR